MTEVNPTQATLLGLFGDQSRTGHHLFDMTTNLMRPYWSTTRSQIYRELKIMEDNGLIKVDKTKPTFRGARYYKITDAGNDAFTSWLMSPIPETLVRDNVAIRIAFGDRITKSRRNKLINEAQANAETKLVSIRELKRDLSDSGCRWDVAALRLAEMQQETLINWLNEVKFGEAN